VRKHKLSASARDALKAAYAQRGGKPGDLLSTAAVPVKVKLRADTHLKCIQDAHGDVNKMVRCG
jgi:hypothetical protein